MCIISTNKVLLPDGPELHPLEQVRGEIQPCQVKQDDTALPQILKYERRSDIVRLSSDFSLAHAAHNPSNLSDDVKTHSYVHGRRRFYVAQPEGFVDPDQSIQKNLPSQEALYGS
ncbi:hypothetical protein Tco_0519542 [Tanacetum coccineum]